MSTQLDMFGAEPSTDDSPVGLAITLPERCPRCSACLMTLTSFADLAR